MEMPDSKILPTAMDYNAAQVAEMASIKAENQTLRENLVYYQKDIQQILEELVRLGLCNVQEKMDLREANNKVTRGVIERLRSREPSMNPVKKNSLQPDDDIQKQYESQIDGKGYAPLLANLKQLGIENKKLNDENHEKDLNYRYMENEYEKMEKKLNEAELRIKELNTENFQFSEGCKAYQDTSKAAGKALEEQKKKLEDSQLRLNILKRQVKTRDESIENERTKITRLEGKVDATNCDNKGLLETVKEKDTKIEALERRTLDTQRLQVELANLKIALQKVNFQKQKIKAGKVKAIKNLRQVTIEQNKYKERRDEVESLERQIIELKKKNADLCELIKVKTDLIRGAESDIKNLKQQVNSCQHFIGESPLTRSSAWEAEKSSPPKTTSDLPLKRQNYELSRNLADRLVSHRQLTQKHIDGKALANPGDGALSEITYLMNTVDNLTTKIEDSKAEKADYFNQLARLKADLSLDGYQSMDPIPYIARGALSVDKYEPGFGDDRYSVISCTDHEVSSSDIIDRVAIRDIRTTRLVRTPYTTSSHNPLACWFQTERNFLRILAISTRLGFDLVTNHILFGSSGPDGDRDDLSLTQRIYCSLISGSVENGPFGAIFLNQKSRSSDTKNPHFKPRIKDSDTMSGSKTPERKSNANKMDIKSDVKETEAKFLVEEPKLTSTEPNGPKNQYRTNFDKFASKTKAVADQCDSASEFFESGNRTNLELGKVPKREKEHVFLTVAKKSGSSNKPLVEWSTLSRSQVSDIDPKPSKISNIHRLPRNPASESTRGSEHMPISLPSTCSSTDSSTAISKMISEELSFGHSRSSLLSNEDSDSDASNKFIIDISERATAVVNDSQEGRLKLLGEKQSSSGGPATIDPVLQVPLPPTLAQVQISERATGDASAPAPASASTAFTWAAFANPATMPPFWLTILFMLMHLYVYWLMYHAWNESQIWMAANGLTRSHISSTWQRMDYGHSCGLAYWIFSEPWATAIERSLLSAARAAGVQVRSFPTPG